MDPRVNRPLNRRFLLAAPFGLAVAAGGAFYAMLRGMERGSFDPRSTGNPQVGRPMPEFDLPAQAPDTAGFGSADIRAAGGPVLVNFFASWCLPCLAEHPVLLSLKQAGIPIWGIAYKDAPEKAAALLARDGDPYARLARDAPGRVGIDFGITGVPETFLIDRAGIIRWRLPGPFTPEIVDSELRPALRSVS